MYLIDTHAHVYDELFNDNLNHIINESLSAGVKKILMPNVDSNSISSILQIESDYPNICYAMMGIHPTYIKANFREELAIIKQWLFRRNFIAVGEIGIDLYWDKTYLKEQQEAFSLQLEWAKELNLPVVIHARDAFAEIFEVLDLHNSPALRGLFHSFSGGITEVDRILNYGGFKIAINGIVTFKNSKLDDAVKFAGLDNILLETDTPYLTPHPHRGKVNKPEYLGLIASKIASILDVSFQEVALITTKNANELFRLE